MKRLSGLNKYAVVGLVGSAIFMASSVASGEMTEVERIILMESHYYTVMAAHDAVIAGDHEAARAALAGLAAQPLPDHAPLVWRPLHEAMTAVAGEAGAITDVAGAGMVVAMAAHSCGRCHDVMGRVPFYHQPFTPDDGETLRGGMSRHQWATERLWDGVAGPVDEAWDRGAAALAEGDIFPDGVGPGLHLMEEELRALGKKAQAARGARERAQIYGRMLATCAACHQEIGVAVNPDR